MIQDPQIRAEIILEWAAVKKLSAHRALQYQLPGGPFFNEREPPDGFYNLPFFLAYAVLDNVLSELIEQGTINCTGKRPFPLGTKMAASKNVVPWLDYRYVEAGKTARNDLAHHAKLITKAECLAYVAAIEVELVAWKVL